MELLRLGVCSSDEELSGLFFPLSLPDILVRSGVGGMQGLIKGVYKKRSSYFYL